MTRRVSTGMAAVVLAAGLALAPPARSAGFPVPAQLRVVNYYPARNGWTFMWQRWDPASIDRDFARIEGLHANTVRVIVQAGAFGFPAPSPLYLQRLDTVIGLAAAHGLRVQLTLFDWWSDYARVADSEQWARAVLGPYAGDPRIACVELQNEIEPNSDAAMEWARTLLPFVHDLAGGIPVTLSVTGADPAARLALLKRQLGGVQPDFWTIHYYDKAELAYPELAAAKAVAAPLPLFVGEAGYFRRDSDPVVHTRADQEDEQVRFLRSLAAAAALLGLPAPAPWILSDFAPDGSPRPLAGDEYHFGLFRVDGTPKPAAAEVRAEFSAARPDLSFNGGFETAEAGTPAREPALWRRTGTAVFALDRTVAHGGRASASIAPVNGRPTAHASFWTQPPAPWVTPGEQVTLSAWARGERATGSSLAALLWYDGARRYLGRSDSTLLPPGTTAWTRLTVRAAAPPGAAYLRVELSSRGNTGRVWFDDVALAAG